MHTVVLGSAGQLGRDLGKLLQDRVTRLTRAELDLLELDSIPKVLKQLAPDVVINCAAYNAVDKAESEPTAAFAVNAFAVRELAAFCRQANSTLVHFSTDYVFGLDESRRTPYQESDSPGPVSVYGLSKLAGEYFARALCPRHFVIRTCGLYGAWGVGGKGGNFVETMLKRAREGKPLRVVADQVCSPTYTRYLAAAVAKLVETEHYGLYHVVDTSPCTWYELAAEIFRLANLQADLTPISSSEYGAAARRPGYSVLATGKYEGLGLGPLRSWQAALAAYLEERGEIAKRGLHT
jgi:dTDP-4-dehydrorhamnose reductase